MQSISIFVILAIAITIDLYALRFIVRSTWVVDLWIRYQSEIRKNINLLENVLIPTKSFIVWILEHLEENLGSQGIKLALANAMTAIVLAIVWSNTLKLSIKVVVTTATVVFYACFALFILLSKDDVVEKYWPYFKRIGRVTRLQARKIFGLQATVAESDDSST